MDNNNSLARTRTPSGSSCRRHVRKSESEEPWDYVSFKKIQSTLSESHGGLAGGQLTLDRLSSVSGSTGTMAGGGAGTHPDVSYQVASKHELEVIYEGVTPRSSRTVTIAIAVLAVILVLGAGAGVALWGAGLLGGDSEGGSSEAPGVSEQLDAVSTQVTRVTSQTESTLSVSSSTSTSTRSSTTFSTSTTKPKHIKVQQLPIEDSHLGGSPSATVSLLPPELNQTQVTQGRREPNLIRDTKRRRTEDNMMMLVMGSQAVNRDHEIGEILGKRRRRKQDGTCRDLERWTPRFAAYLGALYLPAVEALVVCGYSSRTDSRSHSSFTPPVLQQVCHIYHKHLGEWTRVILYENNVFYEGAFIPWHDRLGFAISDGHRTVTRSIMVYKFNPVNDIFGMSGHDDHEAEYYGSGDYAYDDDDDYYHHEGSGDAQDDVHDHVGVSMVRDADHILEKYGPGAVEACGVTITQTQNDVVFVVTGGQNGDGITMRKVLQTQLVIDSDGKPRSGSINNFLEEMKFERRQHGCYRTIIQGKDSIVVAGGLGASNNPIKEVEFLDITFTNPSSKWKVLGLLQTARFGFPTIGRVLGALVVVGGKTHDTDGDSLDIDGSSDKVARAVEIYDEQLHNFRIARSSDQLSQNNVLDKTLLRLTSVNYYGVLFPKQWCNL